MWDIEAWDDLKGSFPDNQNGSRIMLTSCFKDVAFQAQPSSPAHCICLLSEDDSCALLQQRVFQEESCPLELMRVGKQIAAKCQGLPPAVVVVAGLLTTTKTVD